MQYSTEDISIEYVRKDTAGAVVWKPSLSIQNVCSAPNYQLNC